MSLKSTTLLVAAALLAADSANAAQNRAVRKRRPIAGANANQSVAERFRILLPPDFSPDFRLTPIVYALHGYGGTMDGMEGVWKDACAEVGAILIVVQGAKIVGNDGYAWSGFEDAGKMMDAAKKELRKTFKPHRFGPRVLTGMSQGAWATYSLGLRYPKTYRRLIPVVGMFKPRSYDVATGITDNEKKVMKRWRVYMMVGVRDRRQLVSNNHWLAHELERLGAAVKAPFNDKTDPSWVLYQNIGHTFPGRDEAKRTAELVRALKFVLQPDDDDRENWDRVAPDWPRRAKWVDEDRRPAKSNRGKKRGKTNSRS